MWRYTRGLLGGLKVKYEDAICCSDVIKKVDDAIKEMFDNWDYEPNCCDCEFTYDDGDCDNCTMD